MSTDIRGRLEDLHDYIRQGRIIDAMNEFYADDVVMEDPGHGKTAGLQANIEREEQFLKSVKEFRGFEVTRLGTGDDVSFYENVMDWVSTDGTEIHLEQLVVADWRDGKIVRERFYYDTGN